MKINLVFADWQDGAGNSVYFTDAGVSLSAGDFHLGTTFTCDIELDEDSATDLQEALEAGFVPVFYAVNAVEGVTGAEKQPPPASCPMCGGQKAKMNEGAYCCGECEREAKQ